MLGRSLLNRRPAAAAVPPGTRAYAIGDVHGRADLLADLLRLIEDEVATNPPQRCVIVFLGDLIDRGPDSRSVIELAETFGPADVERVFLMGNHEETILAVLDGRPGLIEQWLGYGGWETLESYGVDPARFAALPPATAAGELRGRMPAAHLAFLGGLQDSYQLGDYLFVHAGIRPGVPLAEQVPDDLRWIREEFLNSRRSHGPVVVHGHTIVAAAEDRGNRIAVDTGAFATSRLTALVLDGTTRRFLVAER